MATKIVNVELWESLPRITVENEYSGVWAQIWESGIPVGCAYIRACGSVITPEDLAWEIAKQCGNDILEGEMYHRLAATSTISAADSSYKPFISVLLCTRDRGDDISATLDSLLALDYPGFEVVVVDNCPANDATRELVAKYPFRYAVEPHPGHSWVRNKAVIESRGEILAFIDDDMFVDPGWLWAIAGGFADPEVMGLTGLVLPAELETRAQEIFEFIYGGFCFGFKPLILRPDRDWKYRLYGLGHDTGSYLAFRRESFDKVGLFDTALGAPIGGGEDIDLLYRLIRAGCVLSYSTRAVRYHRHRRSLEGLSRQLAGYGRGYAALLTKYLLNEPELRVRLLGHMWSYYLNWFFRRTIRRVLGRERMPMRLILAEAMGALQGPWVYLLSYRKAR